jgi:hypothetical protein
MREWWGIRVSDWREQQRQRDEVRRAAVMGLPMLKVRHHAAITAARHGDVRVSASVGSDGELIALWSTAKDQPALTSTTTQPGWATFPDPRAPRPVTARVTVHAPEPIRAMTISDLTLAHPTLQPLPHGRILVVGARARWRAEGADRNAIIYDTDGIAVAEETLGDGIEHVFTTSTGHVWVGYFDEGVYGNYGWGNTEAQPPLGACGLARFSPDLQPDWRYPSSDNRWGAISDCYALNVDGDTAWTSYYTDFPVVRVHEGALAGWYNDVTSARALAVGDSRVALYGGSRPHRDRLVVGSLSGERLHITREYRVVLPDGQQLPANAYVIGRGPDLHIITDNDWYRLDIHDIPVQPDD